MIDTTAGRWETRTSVTPYAYMCVTCGSVHDRENVDVVVVGAGQLGVTFALLFDHWLNGSAVTQKRTTTLIERQTEVLRGAARASWIEHSTGFEYFKRGEIETAHACIQGSVVKRLLLPRGLLDLPARIRNRFFVSAESSRAGDVLFDDFLFHARRGAATYGDIYRVALDRFPESERVLARPDEFMDVLQREDYYGVSGSMVAGGVHSAGGAANVPMEALYKEAALRKAESRQAIDVLCGSSIRAIDDTADGVVVSVLTPCQKIVRIRASCVVFTAAHGISDLAALMGARDLSGSYHLNFMVHAKLPRTGDAVLRDYLSSVNFVLQGPHGGMYACVQPPTEHAEGLAALFAPGYDASYVDEYTTNSSKRPSTWDSIIASADFPGRRARVTNVLERIYKLNPFVREYLHPVDIEEHRPVVGSVFNPHGDIRSLRRLKKPKFVGRSRRVMAMTSPKWTTVELAALTLLQCVLKVVAPKFALRTRDSGFGPCDLDLFSDIGKLRLSDVPIPPDAVERYRTSMGLPVEIFQTSR